MANEHSQPHEVRGIRRGLYALLATIFLVLATVGAFLPLLPTTPFLLLASYFLIRFSPKLNSRLLQMRLFGPFLQDWQKYRAIRRTTRRRALLLMSAILMMSFYLTWPSKAAVVTLAICGAIGMGVILRLRVIEGQNELSAPSYKQAPSYKHSVHSRTTEVKKEPRECV
jgi:uncharacterized membrane protein YbaN (DUF454 family)